MTAEIGRVLGGRYRLVTPIGLGASAQVYLADDVRLGRRVAIKMLHEALAGDAEFLRRFRAEARAAAALSHPNIMAVYDWGDEQTAFIVAEYLGGGSLRALLDEGELLSPSQALAVGLEATRALDYAHRRGFVHRDIKPANLLFGDEQRLRIADFGLARALAEAAWTEPQGALMGTARYASPEQAKGEKLSGKADVYALALVLVEAVTGSVPFVADTTLGTLMARVDRQLEVPDALGPLQAVLRRAGHPDPDQRIDAHAVAGGLLRAAASLTKPARLPLAGALPRSGDLVTDEDPTAHGPVAGAEPVVDLTDDDLDLDPPAWVSRAGPVAAAGLAAGLAGAASSAGSDAGRARPGVGDAHQAEETNAGPGPDDVGTGGGAAPQYDNGGEGVTVVGSDDVSAPGDNGEGVRVVGADDVSAPPGDTGEGVRLLGPDDTSAAERDTDHAEGHDDPEPGDGGDRERHRPAAPARRPRPGARPRYDPGSAGDPANVVAGLVALAATRGGGASPGSASDPLTPPSTPPGPDPRSPRPDPAPPGSTPGLPTGRRSGSATERTAARSSGAPVTGKATDGPQRAGAPPPDPGHEPAPGRAADSEADTEVVPVVDPTALAGSGIAARTGASAAPAATGPATAEPATVEPATAEASGFAFDPREPSRPDGPTLFDRESLDTGHDESGEGVDEDDGGQGRRRWPWVLFVLVVLLGVGGVAAASMIDRGSSPAPPVTLPVPALVGTTQSEAEALLDAAGWDVEVELIRRNDTSAGDVLASDPVAGVRHDPAASVTITVSEGQELITVPDDLAGQSFDDAQGALFEVGLLSEEAERRFDEEVPEENVIGVVDGTPAEVERGEPVGLLVSDGPEPREVPGGLVGSTEAEASEAIEAVQLEVGVERRFDGDVSEGQVISASPGPGAEIPRGEEVAIVVSLGVEPVEVPAGLVGSGEGAVIEALEAVPLSVGVERRFDDDVPEGQVLGVSPGPGTELAPGDTVAIVVSLGVEPVTVPSGLVGSTGGEAADAIEALPLLVGVERRFDDEIPEGAVIAASPASGAEVPPGTTVTIVVSLGVEPVTVPDVSEAETPAEAAALLREAGLTPGSVSGPSEGTPAATSPAAGDEVSPGTTVDLILD